VSKRRGLDRADLALFTDGLRAEREQGITIDVAYRYFATPARKFILADCPGHVQYTRNTVTGSSTADVIVLLVDARKGVRSEERRVGKECRSRWDWSFRRVLFRSILADCPGHVQYTRNTVTGSSTADVIVLLVDARKGVIEQTRRHLAVASLLRVPHVVLVVNKIDLVDFSEQVFERVATDFALLARSLGVLDTH